MSQAEVTVYSRPGCPYCYLLRRGLRRRGVTFTEIDIWQQPEAAAAVRAVADGNETVPTVHVAGRWLVNPRAAHVQRLANNGK
ncbi:NrdH-redoxin [Micromonospora sp. Llam7]|uniref:glutaredoxin family protein n=1 Tax=Micromonospora tarapacensis TaxID=2835305 RepID=UPI001C8296DB|nr:glutaredoxin domain-containing protein [Micromonospora tarapacensis]MBX7270113.1 NrdH-redoxin [Micromonospora tarapacensis]